MAVISMIIMYEDESLEVCYGDGSCLQLSPCGSEFLLEKTIPSTAHPLQPTEKIRQRTRFVTSIHKDLMVQALEFRNRFATRPYLPEELIPEQSRTHFFTDISVIEWPASHSCGLEFGSSGEAIISSVDGNASLLLSPSREEFSVEFLCRASQNEHQRTLCQDLEQKPGSKHVKSSPTAGVLNLQQTAALTPRTARDKEGGQKDVDSLRSQPRERHLYTRVIQHHSCSCPPPVWRYPLSLALSLCNSSQEKVTVDEGTGATERGPSCTPITSLTTGEKCRLPEALPLSCPSPHQHRWNFRDSLQKEQDPEQNLRTELVKILWCQGIVYRLINGVITVIEVSPGDGSLIRSKGAVANYFTHHAARPIPGQSDEKTYFINNLPPDVPGQVYSVCSVVTRASRILKCYNQARLSLKLPNSNCCWREKCSVLDPSVLIQEAHVAGSGQFMAFSDGRVNVIFLDGVTLQMMWNFNTSTKTQKYSSRVAGANSPCPAASTSSYSCRYLGPTAGMCLQQCSGVNGLREINGMRKRQAVQPSPLTLDRAVLLERSGLLGSVGDSAGSTGAVSHGFPRADAVVVTENSIAEALQKTSKTIQEIEKLLAVTYKSKRAD
ncbi:hypothetical protein JZ751_027411 [Albula glossodonta]|uniref:DUF4524 domain-containing protein n=1 Tax=Albula glossodonta TaxID=121402 RepID=A0A8T2NJZ2_9TELE|nr:hypothetical protein JZ751_027411 [Albula glossodonta]